MIDMNNELPASKYQVDGLNSFNVAENAVTTFNDYAMPNTIFKYIVLLLPILAAVGAVGYIIYIVQDKKNFSTNKNSDPDEINRRVLLRGTLVSMLSAILMSLIGAGMAAAGVAEQLIVTNYGFLLGPVIGYILDIGIGTEDGFRLIKNFKKHWFYMMSALASTKFLRYIITVLFDLFVSDPIMDVLKDFAKPLSNHLLGFTSPFITKPDSRNFYFKFVGSNFPAILQAIVAFITFNAYTNQTRFNWAYADSSLPSEKRINPFSISLVVSLGAAFYLSHNRNDKDRTIKIIYVLVAIGLLYLMNQYGYMDPVAEEEIENETPATSFSKTMDSVKPYIGMAILIAFILYGFVYPFASAGFSFNPFKNYEFTGPSIKRREKDIIFDSNSRYPSFNNEFRNNPSFTSNPFKYKDIAPTPINYNISYK